MVQNLLTQFKTGLRYNPKLNFNMNNLTPKQKLELVRCRIWGNTVGDNYKSGMKKLREDLKYLRHYQYENAIASDIFPWAEDWEYFHEKKLKIHDRRARILMRGIKIGQKRGVSEGKMSIFDTKKSV